MIVAVVMVYFEHGRMSFTFLYTILLMPLFSAIMSWLSLYSLSIMQTADKDLVMKGEEIQFHIAVLNKGFFITPALLFQLIESPYALQAKAEDQVMTALSARSRLELSFAVSCRYRGVYYIGLQCVQALDFLGLFKINRRWKDKTQLVVYPRVIEIDNFPLSMNLMSKSFSRYELQEEDYSTVSDVRQYLPTDSMKRIHWKLSARRNTFIVKNYEDAALNSTVIFWDRLSLKGNQEYTVAAEDKIVELVVAIGYYCLKKRIPVDLYYSGDEPLSAVNIADFEKLYACSAHSLFDQGESVENPLAAFLHVQTNPINLTVITTRLTEILYDRLAGAYYFGHHVVLLYVPPEIEYENAVSVFSMLKELGMYAYRLEVQDNIHDYF